MPVNPASPAPRQRWIQLALGVVAMMAISSPQYVWTLFVKPFQGTTGASLAAIQITFSIVIVLQTFFSPVQGYLLTGSGRNCSSRSVWC
jgi:MFS transporter, OFA family, oxalate/formate antiporter